MGFFPVFAEVFPLDLHFLSFTFTVCFTNTKLNNFMGHIRVVIFLVIICSSLISKAQTDSLENTQLELPKKYLQQIDSKIDKYTNRITNKTEKTLTKLSRWENKIKTLLQKANPEAAQKLFGNNELTFTTALEKYKNGEAILNNQRAKYNEYRDKLTTSINYLETEKEQLDTKLIKPLQTAKEKVQELETKQDEADNMEQFIKERKKQLIEQSIRYIGQSKYLTKINKESYYYIETLKNYKELFQDKQKAEETALTLLNKIPAFKKFMQENSMLASLFGSPSAGGNVASLAGLQTRTSVNALIQNQIAAGGSNAQQVIQQNIQQAQSELNKLKDKVLKAGGGNNNTEIPDFKPRQTKPQTFKQRLEFGSNFQFGKNNNLLPNTADIGLSLGYKINDKSVAGIGASYKMGMGSIDHISITHQGIGLRSFIDWKLKKQFFITGGYEMNYNAQFKNIQQLQNYNGWQNAGLVGLSKKINVKGKLIKGTKLQLLYDMLARQHVPVSQPIVFRVGYNF